MAASGDSWARACVPPAPEIAVWIAYGAHAESSARAMKPCPARRVGLGPGVPPVAAGSLVPPDGQQLGPHLSERHRNTPARGEPPPASYEPAGCIGTRTPRSDATWVARS